LVFVITPAFIIGALITMWLSDFVGTWLADRPLKPLKPWPVMAAPLSWRANLAIVGAAVLIVLAPLLLSAA
jgi:hypothetical protein